MFRKKSYVIPVTTQNCKDKHLGKRKKIVFETRKDCLKLK